LVIVSVATELGLDEYYNYAGGLGVLEADKFYAAGKLGINYVVITFLYRGGYVDYVLNPESPEPRPQIQPRQPEDFAVREEPLRLRVRGDSVLVIPWRLEWGTAKAILLEVVEPEWLRKAASRVYIEDSEEEKQYKYILLAKAAALYIRDRVGKDRVEVVDLQEAYTALLPLALGEGVRYRFVTHTPGPWGHPWFSADILAREFDYKVEGTRVMLTRLGMELSERVFAVSRKHMEITKELFPEYREKISYVTNGVYLDRWLSPEVKTLIEKDFPRINIEKLREARSRARSRLVSLLKRYKSELDAEGKPILVWARRITKYKRPYFPLHILEHPELARNLVLVLAGKPHPLDHEGRKYLREFLNAHKMLPNVIYVPGYDVHTARILVQGADLLLNTPLSGWEACGTSYMKAMANAVPVLSSRDGGALEVIRHGVNSWLFGEDVRKFIPLNSAEARSIDETDLDDFMEKLWEIINMWGRREYWEISLNALETSINYISIERALKEYYPWVFK
jgi:starch phosphorylase